MEVKLEVFTAPCPAEVYTHLNTRGWWESLPTDGGSGRWNHNTYSVDNLEWSEALAYEMFMHLYHMKEAPNDAA